MRNATSLPATIPLIDVMGDSEYVREDIVDALTDHILDQDRLLDLALTELAAERAAHDEAIGVIEGLRKAEEDKKPVAVFATDEQNVAWWDRNCQGCEGRYRALACEIAEAFGEGFCINTVSRGIAVRAGWCADRKSGELWDCPEREAIW